MTAVVPLLLGPLTQELRERFPEWIIQAVTTVSVSAHHPMREFIQIENRQYWGMNDQLVYTARVILYEDHAWVQAVSFAHAACYAPARCPRWDQCRVILWYYEPEFLDDLVRSIRELIA